ncbi:MAG: biopolymer transporter ExbD [Deltaproteobacteria bacterium]|jgi:biopolymer transport protein ExbD|nr:biopolymer transporter ExbD [Deltaproteobacteria bacterium]
MNFSASPGRSGRNAPVVNMTPLVDVVLQLVIFFMVTAQFAVLPGLRLMLPELASGSLVQTAERLEVSVTSRSDVFFEGRPATPATLGDLLEQTGADGTKAVVLVSADRGADYGTVFQVIEALRLKNFNRVVLGATLPAATADLSAPAPASIQAPAQAPEE